MFKGRRFFAVLVAALLLMGGLSAARPALACGGFFCQNSPVDQNAERIIFTQNGDGTVSAIIQIQYTGSAPDFSWILPLPSAISGEDIEVPETGMNAFLELEPATNPVFIPPPVPDDCAEVVFESAQQVPSAGGGVNVFASGEVGPFGYDVIGSEDPTALIRWLRDNQYMVTEPMEPLINVYVEEGFAFLAMRLLPDQGVQEIKPVKVTYRTERPMIPLRLTAVAANPDMAVIVWIFAQSQAVPANYAHMEIADDELTFFYPFGGNDYRQLMGQRANEFDGQAFITEYAGPTSNFAFADPLLVDLASRFPYLTRLNTVISPEEMTVDPVFDYDPGRPAVSNVHDLSTSTKDQYQCDRVQTGFPSIELPVFGGGQESGEGGEESSSTTDALVSGLAAGGVIVLACGAVGLVGLGVVLLRRSRR
ncbi:MAG: DUF2330 domain-containing protein [Chloroflexi bacterium]|nr:DUF2330 domain-containing protein [Chloroflexota bacterium]